MKIAVVYFSQTGQTRKVAEAIASGLGGPADVKPMEDVSGLDEYDLVFVGMPIHAFGAPESVQKFLERTCTGKRVALFVTHAAPEGMELLDGWLESCKAAAGCSEVVAFFHCQGELAEPVRQYMLSSDDMMLRQFAELGAITKGQPDESRLRGAREFGREVALAESGVFHSPRELDLSMESA